MSKLLSSGLVGAAMLASAAANAATVTVTFSGVTLFTSAEAGGAPWGYDAYGNYIVGDSYSAKIVYNTSAGTTVTGAGGDQSQNQTPGHALDSFTIAGHTYNSTSTSGLADYERASDFLLLNISNTPSDFEGLLLELATNVPISPSLNDPLTLTPVDLAAGAGGNVVMYANGGGVYANFDVEQVGIAVSAPEPGTWTMTLMGFAAAAGVAWRRRTRPIAAA
jgi:hypothetical protein